MKKYRIISLILAAAVIFTVAAIASSCEKKNNNSGVIVDLPTGDATTATTTVPEVTTAQTTEKTTEQTQATQPTVATTAETVPTTPSQTEPTTYTEPAQTTAGTTAPVPTTTPEATTTTPVTNPNVLEYDINSAEFGMLHIKIENVSPVTTVKPKAPSWKDASKTDLRQTCDLVVRAKLVSIQEVSITVAKASPIYGSVLTLEIQQNYYSTEAVASTRIKVYCELSSRYTTTDAADLIVGDEYYFFLESVEGNSKNTIGYENICEYFIALPPTVSYLINAKAEIVNDSMIDLLKNNDRSGTFNYDPRNNFGFMLEEILG